MVLAQNIGMRQKLKYKYRNHLIILDRLKLRQLIPESDYGFSQKINFLEVLKRTKPENFE